MNSVSSYQRSRRTRWLGLGVVLAIGILIGHVTSHSGGAVAQAANPPRSTTSTTTLKGALTPPQGSDFNYPLGIYTIVCNGSFFQPYIVKHNDQLGIVIAKHVDLSPTTQGYESASLADAVAAVAQANHIHNPNRIRAGQSIWLPDWCANQVNS